MFPFLDPDRRARWTATVDAYLATFRGRFTVAFVLVALHLFSFAHTGREHLDLPFNSAPGDAPYFSDPLAKEVRAAAPRQPHHWSRLVVSRWDAQHYISFALRGLSACPEDLDHAQPYDYLDCGLNWFPATGVAAGVISRATGVGADVVLVVMSCLAALVINLLWTCKTIVARLGRREAYATLIAFNVFPSAFHIVTPYTESIAIAFVLAAAIYVANDRWLLAAISVGFATATRLSALAVALAFGVTALVAAVRRLSRGSPGWWRPLAVAPLAAWGFVATCAVFWIEVGTPVPFFHTDFDKGLQLDAWRVLSPTYYVRGLSTQHYDIAVLCAAIAIIVVAGREALRRLGSELAVFVALASAFVAALSVFVLARTGLYWGLTRYLLLSPLIFITAGVLARKHLGLFAVWIVFCAFLYWNVELCSYVTQGRPDLCPCLGRPEWWDNFAS